VLFKAYKKADNIFNKYLDLAIVYHFHQIYNCCIEVTTVFSSTPLSTPRNSNYQRVDWLILFAFGGAR